MQIMSFLLITALLGACQTTEEPTKAGGAKIVGFDFDDTLMVTELSWQAIAKRGVTYPSDAFYRQLHAPDISQLSYANPKASELVRWHQAHGQRVVVITRRPPVNVEPFVAFIKKCFGIPSRDVFFEPESKTKRIRDLGVGIFYTDTDGDVREAIAGGAKAVRFLHPPQYPWQGDYTPGKFGEEILRDSTPPFPPPAGMKTGC